MSQVREHLESADTDFLFFSQTICPYCTRAERTLDAHGLTYTEVNLDHHDGLREALVAETRHRTVPVVFDLRGDEPVSLAARTISSSISRGSTRWLFRLLS